MGLLMKKLIFSAVLLLVAIPCFAKDYYLHPGGSNTSPYDTWTKAATQPSTIVSRITAVGRTLGGDTVYVADGSYNGVTFNTATSGTTLITIKKSTIADHGTETGYSEADHNGQAVFGKLIFSTGYWVFDGITGGGPTEWTTGHGFKVTSSAAGYLILASSVNDITIRHTEIAGPDRDTPLDQRSAYGNGSNNITFSYCWMYYSYKGGPNFVHTDNLVIEYSKIGPNGPSNSTDSIHGYGIGLQDNDTVNIRYNLFEDIAETAYICLVNDAAGEVAKDWSIYGNVFWVSGTLSNTAQSYLFSCARTNTTLSNLKIYNNIVANLTLSQPFYSTCTNGGSNAITNNIYYNNTVNQFNVPSGWTSTYNYYNATTSPTEATKQTATGNPFTDLTNRDFSLVADTDAWTPLTSPYDQDMLFSTRTSSRGAIQYDGSADVDTPDLVSMTVNTSGATATMVLDENVTVNNGTGFTLDCDGGAGEGLEYVSESLGTIQFNVTGRAIDVAEICTFAYTTTGGIVDAAGNVCESIVGGAVTNLSEHTPTEVTYTVTPSTNAGCSISPSSPVSVVTGQTTQFTCTGAQNYRCIAWTGTCGGTGTTTFTTSAITGNCTVIQPCFKIAADSTIGSGATATIGSGTSGTLY